MVSRIYEKTTSPNNTLSRKPSRVVSSCNYFGYQVLKIDELRCCDSFDLLRLDL